MRGGDISSPWFEMAAKMTVIQVHPVTSPLPPPGKTMFPGFLQGATQSSSQRAQEDLACGSTRGQVQVQAAGERVCFWSRPGSASSLSLRPRSGAPLTFPQAPGPLPSTPTLPRSLLSWSQKRKCNSDDNGGFHGVSIYHGSDLGWCAHTKVHQVLQGRSVIPCPLLMSTHGSDRLSD